MENSTEEMQNVDGFIIEALYIDFPTCLTSNILHHDQLRRSYPKHLTRYRMNSHTSTHLFWWIQFFHITQ